MQKLEGKDGTKCKNAQKRTISIRISTVKAPKTQDSAVSKSLRRPKPPTEDAERAKKPSKRKDPTDALGNFISFLDTEKIANDVDFIDIDAAIRKMMECAGNDAKKLVTEINFIRLCSAFDLKVRELMAMMMERYPEEFGLQFMKSTVRPFVVGLLRERNEFRSGTAGYFNKPIFDYL